MNHSFNVEIAKQYGIEKAVILENFYFWIKKNQANKKNMHDGKAYTFNTASAFAELFPYIKERQIAKLLREMESEDELLLSGQFNNYDRTKSYTLTDKALEMFGEKVKKQNTKNVHSNITKSDNGTSQKVIIEPTKKGDCLNTDINSDVNSNINTDKGKKPKKEYDIIYEHYQKNYDILFQQGKVQTNKVQIEYGKCGKLLKGLFRNYSVDELFEILDRGMNDKWIVEGGYNLSILLSANQINKLLNGKSMTSQNGGYVNNKRPASDSDVGEIDF
jgi:hypothetical protein